MLVISLELRDLSKLQELVKDREAWHAAVHGVEVRCNLATEQQKKGNTNYKDLKVKCAFELWCWRRLLRVPWTARRSNESILKEISLEYSLEGLMLKLKLQYFGHLIRRTDSFEKTLMLGRLKVGGEGDDRG